MILLAEFFKTRTNLGPDARWHLFDLTHICILLLTIIFCFIMCFLYKNGNEKKRNFLRYLLVSLMLLEELWMFSISIITKQFEIGFLPLHLCGINIFFCIAHAIWKKDWIADFLYALAFPGALIALLVPTWTNAPAWNFIFIFSTGYHIFLICYPLMLLSGGFKPNYRNIKYTFIVLLGLCIVLFFVNQFNNLMIEKTSNQLFWQSNFMFLNYPESILKTLATIFHLKGYLYLITLPVLLVIVWGIFYSPWIIKEVIKNKKRVVLNE